MSSFRPSDLVWAPRVVSGNGDSGGGESVTRWWPAVLTLASNPFEVKFLKAESVPVVVTEVAHFDLTDDEGIHFGDKALAEAVNAAINMKKKKRDTSGSSKVLCVKTVESIPRSPEPEEEDVVVDLGRDWKDEFLASLDDDDDDEKENDVREDTNPVVSSPVNKEKKRIPLMEKNEKEKKKRPPTLFSAAKKRPATLFSKKIKKEKVEKAEKEEEEEENAYERIRRENVEKKKAMLAALMECKTQLLTPTGAEIKKEPKKRRIVTPPEPSTRPRRSMTPIKYFEEEDSFLPRKKSGNNNNNKPPKVGNGEQKRKSVRGPRYDPNADALTPDQVTEEMLENVADKVSEKIYDFERGTSCHQCRQKTADTKSICRSGRCVGVKGMFCGVCLLNRYGEKVRQVLLDPEWQCPPCRNVCNCSICRNKQGKGATGIATPLAQAKGFNSVRELLDSMKKGSRGEEIFEGDE